MKKPPKKSTARAWRVVCVLGDGRVSGDCGHDHRSRMAAVRCRYVPRAYERDLAAELRVAATGGPQ